MRRTIRLFVGRLEMTARIADLEAQLTEIQNDLDAVMGELVYLKRQLARQAEPTEVVPLRRSGA